MNERIRQCADGAGLDSNWKPGFDSIYGQQLEKFAELIVRECICQCDDENSQKYIMSHFGFTEKDWI